MPQANWWTKGGATGYQAAYTFINVASQADSYIDLTGNGHNLTEYNPSWPASWSAAAGVGPNTFAGLKTGLVVKSDQTWSIVARYANVTNANTLLFGNTDYLGSGGGIYICPNRSTTSDIEYSNGGHTSGSAALGTGVLTVAGTKGYKNASQDVTMTLTGSTNRELFLIANNDGTSITNRLTNGTLMALAVYNTVLTADMVAAIVAAVADDSTTYSFWGGSTLSASTLAKITALFQANGQSAVTDFLVSRETITANIPGGSVLTVESLAKIFSSVTVTEADSVSLMTHGRIATAQSFAGDGTITAHSQGKAHQVNVAASFLPVTAGTFSRIAQNLIVAGDLKGSFSLRGQTQGEHIGVVIAYLGHSTFTGAFRGKTVVVYPDWINGPSPNDPDWAEQPDMSKAPAMIGSPSPSDPDWAGDWK